MIKDGLIPVIKHGLIPAMKHGLVQILVGFAQSAALKKLVSSRRLP